MRNYARQNVVIRLSYYVSYLARAANQGHSGSRKAYDCNGPARHSGPPGLFRPKVKAVVNTRWDATHQPNLLRPRPTVLSGFISPNAATVLLKVSTVILNRPVILLGPPGAGKGTQAKYIAKNYGVPHLSTGDIFRAAIAKDTSVGREVASVMHRGQLLPDALVAQIMTERIALNDCVHGCVFDGFPRTLRQAIQLDEILRARGLASPFVIQIQIDSEQLLRRLSGRLVCTVNGETYNLDEAPPKVPGTCDFDGGRLIQRPDDRPEVISERLEAYTNVTRAVASYYSSQGALFVVDGTGSMADVSRAIEDIIRNITANNANGCQYLADRTLRR